MAQPPAAKYTSSFLRELPSGFYQGNLRYKENGEWKTKSKSLKTNKKREAKRLLQEWMSEQNAIARGDIEQDDFGEKTVYEVVREYLDSQLAKNEIERTTYHRSISCIKTRVKPYIGSLLFSKLTRKDIEGWITVLSANGYARGTILTTYSIVAKVYKHYFRIEEIPKNPFDHVQTPKGGKPRVTFLNDDQLFDLISELNAHYDFGTEFWTAINLAVLTGMRRGELCGLRWNEIDFNRNCIRVTTAIGQVKDAYAKHPKNDASYREFPMSEQAREILQFRKQYVEEHRGPIQGSWYVISDKEDFLSPSALAKRMYDFTREWNLKDHYGNYVTLHSLRHNFATMGVKTNVDIAALAHMLGHADVAMTLNTYSTVDPQSMLNATNSMGEAWHTTNPDVYYAEAYDEEETEEDNTANDNE